MNINSNNPYKQPNTVQTLPYPQYSPEEFEQREEQYNYQIQKMSDHINQLEHEIHILDTENQGFKNDFHRMGTELVTYKEQLKKLFDMYQDQSKQFDFLKKRVNDSNTTVDRAFEKQIDTQNNVQNLILDRDLLLNKLEIGDKQYNFDVQSLTAQLHDKNAEIQDQRKRIADLLDMKKKAEEEIASLRFTLDHQTTKLESELREKTLKLEAMDKQFQEALYLKDNELVDAFDKIRLLEHEIRRILDLNRNYAQELSLLARDNRFKQDELIKKNDNNNAQPQQQQHLTVQTNGMEKKMPKEFQDRLHLKIDQVLDVFERSHAKEVKQLCLNLWKTKMELQARNKQNVVLNQETASMAKGTPVAGGGTIDFRIPTYLLDSMIAVISYTRDQISGALFELFVKNVNKANNKKLNSFVLFFEGITEKQKQQYKGLTLSCEVYSKLRKALRQCVPLLIDSKVTSGLLDKVELAMGKLMKHDLDFRNSVNKWLEGTLAFTIQKKDQENYDKNRDYLFLFRLLTIKYRVKFPLQGKTFEVDVDLETFLDHKICYGFKKILKSMGKQQ
ncbi:hypothetical protein pb186bvf_019536 [Paramecium bursaria]